MPIPFLLIGLGAGAAALGVGKTVKAGIDQKEANETNKDANIIIKRAKDKAEKSRKNSMDAINSLGEEKIYILDSSVMPFINDFEKLHNVELSDSVGMDEMKKFHIDKQSFEELKEMGAMASSIAGGVAGGAVLGAAAAFGAYGAAMTFGAASTGTAIAALSGAAATNATLAFLGGGSLAVGGLGMAGGMAVLGGLVAGPALAVLGFVAGGKASANKDAAYENLAKAKEIKEELENVCVLCKGIRMRANMFERLLIKLNVIFAPLAYSFKNIIETSGTDYSQYSTEQKKTVAACLTIAGAIKSVLDTPILTEDGKLTDESKALPAAIQPVIDNAQ